MDKQIALNADGDESYRLTLYPIELRNHVKIFTADEIELHFIHAEFTPQQIVIYSQRDWTSSIDNLNFNQIVDNALEKFEVARAVKFVDLSKQAQLQEQFLQQSQYTTCFNKLFINGKEFTIGHLN